MNKDTQYLLKQEDFNICYITYMYFTFNSNYNQIKISATMQTTILRWTAV